MDFQEADRRYVYIIHLPESREPQLPAQEARATWRAVARSGAVVLQERVGALAPLLGTLTAQAAATRTWDRPADP